MDELRKRKIPSTLVSIPSAGEHEAVLEFGGKEAKRTSFDALLETADQLAAGLRSIGDEDSQRPIILFAPASTEAIIAAIGVLRAGRIVAPLDTQMQDKDLLQVLKNADAKVVLTTKRMWQRLKALEDGPELECFLVDTAGEKGDADSEDSDEPPSWQSLFKDSTDKPSEPKASDIAVLFYTSGTTGPPKGVPLSHENVRFQIETVIRTGLIEANDRMLQPLPLHHVYPFVIGTLAPLALGLPIILPGALTGKALATALQEGEATVTLGVPRLYKAFFGGIRDKVSSLPAGRAIFHTALALAKGGNRMGLPIGRVLFRPIRKKAAPRLRLLASGGSPLDLGLARNLEALGWPVAIGYGLTETAPLLTLKKPGEASFDSIGRAVEGVELRVDPDAIKTNDDDDPESDHDAGKGELLARGPNVFSGYYHNEDATKESFTESGWFRTGDVASIDPHGVVRLSGRVSTRIALQGGENVDPASLEDHYETTDGVEEIGILEHEGKLAALVVPEKELVRDSDKDTVSDQIREALKKKGGDLPSYQQLAQVEISTDALARTRLGKLRRHELEEAFEKARKGETKESTGERGNGPLPEAEFSSQDRALLENSRARALWDLLCERYADQPVAPDADLESELGIDSLEWVELSMAIETATGASADESMMGQAEKVRDLLEVITDADEVEDEQASKTLREPGSVLKKNERKWADSRGPGRQVIGWLLYPLIWGYLRLSLRVEAKGVEHLPEDRQCILIPNHVSYLDGPCIGVALGYGRARRFFWAGVTKVMFRNAFVRGLSRLAQVVPIDPRRGPISSLAITAYVLEQKKSLVWFPEGRVSSDGSLQDFQPGIGLLLKHHAVPVVPVYVEGTHAALPRGKRLPRWGKVRVYFGPVIESSSLRKDGENQEPKEIASALREAVKELAEKSRQEEEPD